MTKIISIMLLIFISACARTYHNYIYAFEGSTVVQNIEIKAEVPKNIDVEADTDADILPEGL